MIIDDTNEAAEFQASSMYKMFLNIIRGTREPLSPPFENLNSIWRPEEETYVKNMLSCSFIGDISTVQKNMLDFQKVVKMDELIISVPQYDHTAKLKTLELARGIFS
jgi:hypothetical protein